MNPKSIKRIAAAVDFSEPSADAVAMAVGLARAFGASIELVHVVMETTYVLPPPIDVATVPINMAKIMGDASARLATEQARVSEAGVSCTSTLLVGHPDAEIVSHAQKSGADLIVVGTHGRSGLAHVLLGSVATKVVHHARCPVLVVPRR